MTITQVRDVASQEGHIKVSSKTLGLISAGIYRTPAGAIKELISNAFDADADWVRISMNAPSFDIVSIKDNGSGIEYSKFISLMERQIGDSDKRSQGDRTPIKNRPIIGRIGIGLLAIAQICHAFEVVSHRKHTRTAFRSQVQMTDYLQEEMDAAEADLPSHDIGTYRAERIDFDETNCGTTIIATQLKPGFIIRLRKESPPLPRNFSTFFADVVKHDSLRELSEYWRTTWSIALAAPLPYLDDGPVRDHSVDPERQRQLEDFAFRVEVDQMPVRRPVLLPPRAKDQRQPDNVNVVTLKIDQKINGSWLKGQGYIYSQGGKSIYPSELRGLLIRIKGVAIGEYDKNFLDYPLNEGPRISWLSGELNVDEGLEDALNIDRDSFNQAHPHYIAVQQLIHDAMDKEVRPWLYRNLDDRKKERDREAEAHQKAAVNETIATVFPDITRVEHVNRPSQRGQAEQFVPPVLINTDDGRVEVNDAAAWPRARRNRELAEQIAIGFEAALAGSSPEEIRRRFYAILRQILA